ncbi:hypothetical protein B0H14DRAFT_3623932 [Mycena olivaceomarginata]|nr:hypothetical protein B0H14DRAFT_3623932 [Mycena olivaceomarginata]
MSGKKSPLWLRTYGCHVSAITIAHQSTLIAAMAQNIGIEFLITHILEFGQKSGLVPRESRKSQNSPPIADTVGALEDLISALRPILIAEKYFSLFDVDECDVYCVAIIMSPDKKLDWSRNRRWSEEDISRMKEHVVSVAARWLPPRLGPLPYAAARDGSSIHAGKVHFLNGLQTSKCVHGLNHLVK